jgi:hypothetical protein
MASSRAMGDLVLKGIAQPVKALNVTGFKA